MIYELARILAAVYLGAKIKRRSSVYFGLHANIPVRDHVADYCVITMYEFLTRIPSQQKDTEHL